LKAWTREEALETLKKLADEAERLRASEAFSTEHTLWMTQCYDTLEDIFGPASRYFLTFAEFRWHETSSFTFRYEHERVAKHHAAFLRDLGSAKGLLLGAINYLSKRELSDIYSAKDTGPETSLILKVLHLAEQKLRKVIRDKPEKERQIQDAFENLLIGADIPYGREVDSIEYSSKTYTPDFSLKKINLAVEIKLCNREEREKELPAEINDDILAYSTKYQNLLFIIYDLGHIRDKDKFCSSFEKHDNVTVRVVKH
jgi:hypothetical protein